MREQDRYSLRHWFNHIIDELYDSSFELIVLSGLGLIVMSLFVMAMLADYQRGQHELRKIQVRCCTQTRACEVEK